MVLLQLALIAAAFGVLSKAADAAIKRLVLLSRMIGVSEFSISFIIAGMLAALPELSIGVNSALEGKPTFGLGVIFGSNVADLTLVLGSVALFSGGIALKRPEARRSKWYLLAVALPLLLLLLDGQVSRIDGAILVAAYGAYAYLTLRDGKVRAADPPKKTNLLLDSLVLLASIGLVLLCGKVITDASAELGIGLGVPLFFIGVVIAVGTCLPELSMALKAAKSNHGGLGFGNILGNVVADCMLTLGIIALINPIVPDAYQLAMGSGILMVLSMCVVAYLLRGKNTLSQNDGALLISLYVFFLLVQTLAEKLALSA